MGRFKHSVVGIVGLLACLVHHVCPQVMVQNIPMYNWPTALSSLQFAAGTSYPSGGKSYFSTNSASSNRGPSYQRVRPSYVVGRSMAGYVQNPNVYTVTSRRPMTRSRISYTSVPTASTYRLINPSYRPRIVRQPTTHYVQTHRGSMIHRPRRPTISIATQLSRHRTSSRPVLTRIAATPTTRSSTNRQTARRIPTFIPPSSVRAASAGSSRGIPAFVSPSSVRAASAGSSRGIPAFISPSSVRSASAGSSRGIPAFIPPSSVRSASAGSSRVGIAPKVPYVKKPYVKNPVKKPYVKKPYVKKPYVKKPYVKKPYVGVPYVRKATKKPTGHRGPLVKKYKKKSKRKSKSKKSKKSKAIRKAELKAKLKAMKAKRKYKSQKNILG